MLIDDLALSLVDMKRDVPIKLLERFGLSQHIFQASLNELTADNGLSLKYSNIIVNNREYLYNKAESIAKYCSDNFVKIVSYTSSEYPLLLKECTDAPLVLYTLGNLNLSDLGQKILTITGSGRCSSYGKALIDKLVSDISTYHSDCVIVTGLSDGVERLFHSEAIKRGLKTIVVLATRFDDIGDKRELISQTLRSGGSVVTEYNYEKRFFDSYYAERNRIVAGLSHATVMIESGAKSKTHLTANLAVSYHRELFAFPGGVFDDAFVGNNFLIKTGRARLITSLEDIEYEMGWERSNSYNEFFAPTLSPIQGKIYNYMKLGVEHSDEELLDNIEITISELMSSLTLMEAQDIIKSNGRLYRRIR